MAKSTLYSKSRILFKVLSSGMSTKANIIVSCPSESFGPASLKDPKSIRFSFENTTLGPNDFLTQQPTGCYSGARTFKQRSVMNFQSHLNRLLLGMQNKSFGQDEEPSSVKERLQSLRDSNLLFPLVKELCKAGIGHYFEGATSEDEAKLTILVSYDANAELPVVKLHLSPLSVPKGPICEVEVYGHPRSNPSVKDSQWVRDRREIEKGMAPGINEVLLVDDKGHVFEGMSSNFFAVVESPDGHQIWTSPLEHVLRGTVMDMIIEGCKHLNIPLVFKLPSIHDAARGSWSSAFITSTSRLMLPISKLHIRDPQSLGLPDSDSPISVSLASPLEQPHIMPLLNYVKSQVESHATSLL
ncbi:hypothetical protein DSO57_1027356 [Entomophthora muscae]|uniref:Uncharacterized protein n=1 Tax=Entomophthora muscae TaxID=34485 RepID=A0ACC2TDC7_9FUNG|nr:hypothetical protein DSO57_1027356 [Entomophthora muscae]